MVLIIDGFGIGATEDCHEYNHQDCNAKTFQNIRKIKGKQLQVPTLYKLGLGALVDEEDAPNNAFGYSKLAHHGADTYLGHQEIVGSCPKKSNKRLMKDIHQNLKKVIEKSGHTVSYPLNNCPVLLVNNSIVVGDNLESVVGNIINVTADLSRISFEETKTIGKIIRDNVDTTRVIAFGGPNTSIAHIINCIENKREVQWGVNTPKANVYGTGYEVYHMGYGVEINRQFPMIAAKNDIPVYRLGKTADVLHGQGPAEPIVNTTALLKRTKELYVAERNDAAFLVNVQETDLAGHAEDVDWYCSLLNEVDQWLESFMSIMGEDDILIIMADHGNDPTIGHSNHTREHVPLLITGNSVRKTSIGLRETMADVGATLCELFHLPMPAEGISFLAEILKSDKN